jgi:hypothetical protein
MISTYVQGRNLGAIDAQQANGLGTVSPANGGQLVMRAATGVAGTGLGGLGGLTLTGRLSPTNVTYNIEGFEGTPGTTGIQGGFGPQGVQGIPGASIVGPAGQMGSQGPVGPMGPIGQQGAKGDQGVQGIKGDDGEVDYSTVLDLIKSNGIVRGINGTSLYTENDSIVIACAEGITSVTMSRTDVSTYAEWLVRMYIGEILIGSMVFYQYNEYGVMGGFDTNTYSWAIFGSLISGTGDNVVSIKTFLQYKSGPGTASTAAFIDKCSMASFRITE